MSDPVIRPYRPSDRDAVYDVCLRTAEGGQDATALFRDPELVGDVFAGPYALLEPDFAFVLDDGHRAVGYVLGVPDTARFARRVREEWLPLVGPRHPEPASAPVTKDDEMAFLLHHPERMVIAELADHPAHLHIDLLPGHQRAGHGRRLIHTLLDALRKADVPRVHLSMLTTNTPARAFYDRLGFRELAVHGLRSVTYLGRSTDVD
ncbi:MAG TPA: GNAT family N-acetyltransferase [Pseudonocardiaceae bacterium]|jgi:ribosomal protein S18 acetylase RimI-like enzyme|nr:GNAT family N-acetyltransferase [Pseudonocardiaceae bacterium]